MPDVKDIITGLMALALGFTIPLACTRVQQANNSNQSNIAPIIRGI